MINRTKLSVIAVSAVLAVALTGCGGSRLCTGLRCSFSGGGYL